MSQRIDDIIDIQNPAEFLAALPDVVDSGHGFDFSDSEDNVLHFFIPLHADGLISRGKATITEDGTGWKIEADAEVLLVIDLYQHWIKKTSIELDVNCADNIGLSNVLDFVFGSPTFLCPMKEAVVELAMYIGSHYQSNTVRLNLINALFRNEWQSTSTYKQCLYLAGIPVSPDD